MGLSTQDLPKAQFKPRTFDESKPTPNRVTLEKHGPRAAKLSHVSKVFYEKNIGDDTKPNYVGCVKDDPNAIPRFRVYVKFDKLKNLEGNPLSLGTTMRASVNRKSQFGKLLAALTGLSPEVIETTNIDIEALYGTPVIATTKATAKYNTAFLAKIEAVPKSIDDEDGVTAAAPIAKASAAPQGSTEYDFDEEDMGEIPF